MRKLTTARKEKDKFELLSGFFEGRTTGAPLSFIIRNENKRGKDYEILTNLYRPDMQTIPTIKNIKIMILMEGGDPRQEKPPVE